MYLILKSVRVGVLSDKTHTKCKWQYTPVVFAPCTNQCIIYMRLQRSNEPLYLKINILDIIHENACDLVKFIFSV